MPRPTTKTDLIKTANGQFEKMWALIDSMSAREQSMAFKFDENMGKEAHWKRDKTLRDVLIHLYEWHQLLIAWIDANQKGKAEPFLPAPYNWKTYGEMNQVFWKKHQATPYADSKKMLINSHKKVMALIDGFSDKALFERQHFPWTGGTTLGSYCVSATSSHYDWATKKIKAHIKSLHG